MSRNPHRLNPAALALALAALAAPALAPAQSIRAQSDSFVLRSVASGSLQCRVGPVRKAFAGGEWDVYGCSDGKSVVAMSVAGRNAAAPQYFMFAAELGGYNLFGEGAGDPAAARSAYDALSLLSAEQILSLRRDAERASR